MLAFIFRLNEKCGQINTDDKFVTKKKNLKKSYCMLQSRDRYINRN